MSFITYDPRAHATHIRRSTSRVRETLSLKVKADLTRDAIRLAIWTFSLVLAITLGLGI